MVDPTHLGMPRRVFSAAHFHIRRLTAVGRTSEEIAEYLNGVLPRAFGDDWCSGNVRKFAKRHGPPVPVPRIEPTKQGPPVRPIPQPKSNEKVNP